LVQLTTRSDTVGVQVKNASSYYTKKTTRKLVTQHATDVNGRNIMITLLKRVASMTELQMEQVAAQESGKTLPGRIMKFIRSHTKTDLQPTRNNGLASMGLSFRSNRISIDPQTQLEQTTVAAIPPTTAAAVASLNIPVDHDQDEDHQNPPPLDKGSSHHRSDPNESKDCEDQTPLRSSPHEDLLLLHQPQIPHSSITLPPLSLSSTQPVIKRKIVKKLSKSNSSIGSLEVSEAKAYKSPLEYIRQNSNPTPPNSCKAELRSSPSLPIYSEDKFKKIQKNNFMSHEEKLSLHIPSGDQIPLHEATDEQEEKLSSSSLTPVITPTRYDRKTTMKLDSTLVPKTPREHPLGPAPPLSTRPQFQNHSEGESTNMHSSDSLVPDVDPYSWEHIKDQFFTTIQNGADEAFNALGLRQFGSSISLNDCLKSTFNPLV
jgi:hypothetical protein